MAVIRKLELPEENENPPVDRERKQHRGSDHDDSNWLISYADMMTLLCVFYIMMFSMSKVNTPEFEKVKKEVSKHFGTKYESPTEDLGKFVTQVITEAGVAKEVSISTDGVGVSLAFYSTLFFGSSSADISSEGKQIVDRVAEGLLTQQKKTGKAYKIVVEGHTDSQAVLGGPFPSNWELSSSRATRVIRLFIDHGFSPENLLAIGYADTQPLLESRNPDGSWNEAALAKNRRVVLRVLLPEVDSIAWKIKSTPTAKSNETVGESPASTKPSTEVPAATTSDVPAQTLGTISSTSVPPPAPQGASEAVPLDVAPANPVVAPGELPVNHLPEETPQ